MLTEFEYEDDFRNYAPVSDGFTDQRDEDEADQEYCDLVAFGD